MAIEQARTETAISEPHYQTPTRLARQWVLGMLERIPKTLSLLGFTSLLMTTTKRCHFD